MMALNEVGLGIRVAPTMGTLEPREHPSVFDIQVSTHLGDILVRLCM